MSIRGLTVATADATLTTMDTGDVVFEAAVDSQAGDNFALAVNTSGGGDTIRRCRTAG